ncbi:MAG: alpha/beta hydrolase, partial [Gemmatimonadales bacterium]
MSLPAHRIVRAEGHTGPGPRLYVLHGFLGSGRNWSSFARRLAELRPDWRVVLVDLRLHGDSLGLEGPHTIAAAAEDVVELHAASGDPALPAAVLGHSLGGKVALAVTKRMRPAPRQTWIIDSTPEAGGSSGNAGRMLARLAASPDSFDERDAAVRWIRGGGFDEPTARWMVTNLEERDGAWRWRLDAAALRELLEDFGAQDMWDVVESPPEGADLHFVRASRGTILTGPAAERLDAAAAHGA